MSDTAVQEITTSHLFDDEKALVWYLISLRARVRADKETASPSGAVLAKPVKILQPVETRQEIHG